jgi:hypothetical protein
VAAGLTTIFLGLGGQLIAFCAISEGRNLEYGTRILYNGHDPNVFSWDVAIGGFIESF